MDQELNTTLGEINQRGTKNGGCSRDSISRNSANLETVITVTANEMRESCEKSNGSMLNQAIPAENGGGKMEKVEDNCSSCVIGVECEDGGSAVQIVGAENQRVCRICQLSVKEIGGALMELIELGCGCKGEIGAAHTHCSEAWFKVRGNRMCEICGEVAKNITGVSHGRFLEEWNDNRFVDREISNPLQGKPLCTFFMACLVIAFVLPLIFRINLF